MTHPSPTLQQQMHDWQEEQIRRTTRALGFNPLSLPADDRTRNFNVKVQIRARCASNHPVKMRAAMFNQAWERMLAASPQRLKYADP